MSTDQTTRRSGRHRSGGRVSVPARIAPGAAGPRLPGLDLARGLAVLSMLVAHLSPVGGVLDLSEYLTAPLFAVLVGAAMGLVLARPGTDPVRFVADNALRGLLLVALGVMLQALYPQIDVVLPYLGVLVVVLAPLAVALHRLPVLTLGLAVGAAVLGPVVTERARDALVSGGPATGTGARHLLDWLAAGPSYRLVSFLPMALGGLALALLLPRLAAWRPAAGVAAVLLAAAGVVHALGAASSGGAAPYSGTTAEVVAGSLLAAGVVAASCALADVAAVARWGIRALDPVLSLGRLALTAYTVQVLFLAVVAAVRGGARDDTWPVLLLTTAVVVGSAWLLDRTWGTGPLELVVRLARLPDGWQPGAALSDAVSAARQRRGPPEPPGSTPPEE
ncbi:hypothetical protein G7075_11230 [Phycicoccus sp. HDW14]|uniref:acyltransferase family protein n=1 Tax=Phycicoccus sp. HDW14 TaxID=2714941 RepID=UPI00140A5256|nr:acyltransferase family protein [Phycicoccus sp. HDW14]QIM21568.1 hypothetical protein G7075_11230 [Phycicoccus sp. HDW14]